MMKVKLGVILSIGVLLSVVWLLLMPKSYYFFSEKFDMWNARCLRSVLHTGRFFLDPSFKENYYATLTSKIPLDVVIPLVEKDLMVAKETIKTIHAMVLHPIHDIYIVAPESATIREFCKENGCIFILENDVVDDYQKLRQLGGWIIQQFIKFNVDRFTKSEHVLIVDADTIFLRPQIFIDDKKGIYTFHVHSDYAEPRKKFTRDLLKTNQYFKLDFVTHHMVFKRAWLQELKVEITRVNGCSWQDAILRLAAFQKEALSEYEIYATFVLLKHREFTRLLSSANIFMFRDKFKFLDLYRGLYSTDYKSISSHSYMKFKKE